MISMTGSSEDLDIAAARIGAAAPVGSTESMSGTRSVLADMAGASLRRLHWLRLRSPRQVARPSNPCRAGGHSSAEHAHDRSQARESVGDCRTDRSYPPGSATDLTDEHLSRRSSVANATTKDSTGHVRRALTAFRSSFRRPDRRGRPPIRAAAISRSLAAAGHADHRRDRIHRLRPSS